MTTSGVKFEFKFDFSVPISYMEGNFGNWTTISLFLANFLLCMRRNGQNSTSSQIFNPKFEIPMGCLLFEYEFWWRFCQDLCVLSEKRLL